MMRRAVIAAAVVLVTLAMGEIGARWIFGLGDPPLTIRDPDIDYLFAPNQNVRRFKNHIVYNQWSMRSRPICQKKVNARELRILVVGDSVVNGGVLTDQAALGTSRAEERLSLPDRPVFVGNVSAGSWGPENQLAYVRRFGWFDADLAIIVVSTHDLESVRAFLEDLGPDFPTERPVAALWELVTRYAPRFLGLSRNPSVGPVSSDSHGAQARASAALEELIRSALEVGTKVVLLHHPERTEPEDPDDPRKAALAEVARKTGVPLLYLADAFGPAGTRAQFYRDHIHINEEGQEVLGNIIVCLAEADIDEVERCVHSKE